MTGGPFRGYHERALATVRDRDEMLMTIDHPMTGRPGHIPNLERAKANRVAARRDQIRDEALDSYVARFAYWERFGVPADMARDLATREHLTLDSVKGMTERQMRVFRLPLRVRKFLADFPKPRQVA